MNSVKQMARILWLFISWLRLMKWIALFGLALMVFTLIVAAFNLDSPNTPKAAAGFVSLGLLFALVFPFFTSGIVFRKLASSRQFSLAPRGNYLLFLAVLIFTVTISTVPYLLFVASGAPSTPGIPILIFCVASLLIGFFQLNFPMWAVSLLGWAPMLWFLLLQYLPASLLKPFVSAPAILVYLILSVSGWVFAFIRIRRGFRLQPTSISMSRPLGSTRWETQSNYNWRFVVQARSSRYATDSLYYNMLVSWRTRFMRIAFPLFIVSMVVVVVSIMNDNARLRGNLFLLALACGAVFTLFGQIETMPRSRLLWLRMGKGRQEIWKTVEANLLRESLVLLTVVIVFFLLVSLIQDMTLKTALRTFATVACGSVFFGYFPLFCRLRPGLPNDLLLFFGSLIAGVGFLICAAVGIGGEKLTVLFMMNVTLLVLGLLFRLGTKKRFMAVDWLTVKPKQNYKPRPVA